MRIAVAGGTGTIGSEVVAAIRARGDEAVVLSRSNGVDVRTGEGLVSALEGVDALVDAANVSTLSAKGSTEFFTTSTRTMLAAEREAGVGHHVLLSIVGVDRAPYGYYAGKLAQERAVEAGDVPWTILRATQAHEFAGQMFDALSIGPLHLAPVARTQPVAASEVGRRLAELAAGAPSGHVRDLAGPREERLDEMTRAYARAHGARGPVLSVKLPGRQFAAMRAGEALPREGADLTRLGFDEWLASAGGREAGERARV
ncbi:nucleoside-diphosphate sugar epimerase [Agromyces rhizosphaerae]|uniref:Nucleoside-diphosphate sugar epimerase n=1 Tax=Agromyces rhizosphaerae TaxID=88374 RepID=A0A9W6CUJ8_9MICO|nr:SDR family oxidoreductase [Agromyces rhizosphaerae]GLI26331.1 nucleoside-diphosphate sugar epimerase [Agromyces rhizosphaerae]